MKKIFLFIKKIKRFGLHCLRKPFLNNFTYKYFPRIFLFMRLGILGNINTEAYWSHEHNEESVDSMNRFDNKVLRLLPKIDFKNKDILDVGCGQGIFLSKVLEAKSRSGVDISAHAIKEVEKKDIKGYVRELPVLNLEGTYDIITCFETLEHTKFWKESIRAMIDRLREDGYLIISVPYENAIVISEHVTYFDINRLYNFLRKKVYVLEIKNLGAWILVIAQKQSYIRGEVPQYFSEIKN